MRAMDHDAKKAAAATAVGQRRRRRHDLLLVVSSSLVTLAVYKLALFVLQDPQVSIGSSGSSGSSSSSSRRMQMDVSPSVGVTSSQTPSTQTSLLSRLTAPFLRGKSAWKRAEEEEEGDEEISWQWQQKARQSKHSPVLGPLTYVGPTNDVWPVFARLLSNQSVVYSFGSSCDTGWDFDLIDAFGANVYVFDNAPESLDCLRKLQQVARSDDDDEQMSQTPPAKENLPALANSTRGRRRRPPPNWSHFPYRLAETNGLVRVNASKRFLVAVDASAIPGEARRRMQEKERKKEQGLEGGGKEGRGASGALAKEGEGGHSGASGRKEGEEEEEAIEGTVELEFPGRTLESIMANFNAAEVDVMRIDMGGDELGILHAWTKKAVKLPVCQLLISFRTNGQHQMALNYTDKDEVRRVVDGIQQSLGFLLVASAARTTSAKPHAPPSAVRYLFVNEGVCKL